MKKKVRLSISLYIWVILLLLFDHNILPSRYFKFSIQGLLFVVDSQFLIYFLTSFDRNDQIPFFPLFSAMQVTLQAQVSTSDEGYPPRSHLWDRTSWLNWSWVVQVYVESIRIILSKSIHDKPARDILLHPPSTVAIESSQKSTLRHSLEVTRSRASA